MVVVVVIKKMKIVMMIMHGSKRTRTGEEQDQGGRR